MAAGKERPRGSEQFLGCTSGSKRCVLLALLHIIRKFVWVKLGHLAGFDFDKPLKAPPFIQVSFRSRIVAFAWG